MSDDKSGATVVAGIRFIPELNVGHILQILALLGALVHFITEQQKIRLELDGVKTQVTSHTVLIEDLRRENIQQGERIAGLSSSAAEARKSTGDLIIILTSLREDVASIKARLQIDPIKAGPR